MRHVVRLLSVLRPPTGEIVGMLRIRIVGRQENWRMGLIVSAAFAILLLITLRVLESISTVRPPMDMVEASWIKPHLQANRELAVGADQRCGFPLGTITTLLQQGEERASRSSREGHAAFAGEPRQPIHPHLTQRREHIHAVKSQVGEAQAPFQQNRMLHGDGVVGCPTIHEVKATECAGEEVELDAAFEARGPATGVVATPTPDRRQRIGKLDTRALVNPNAGEALEDGNGNRVGGNDVLHARQQHLMEQRCRGIGEPLINSVW